MALVTLASYFCPRHAQSYTDNEPCSGCFRERVVATGMRAAPGGVIDTGQLRPVLLDFAGLMEDKLKKNDHKKGWSHLPVEALFKMLMIEIEEFKVAHEFFDSEEARKELIDVANFCMILFDRLGMEAKNVGIQK